MPLDFIYFYFYGVTIIIDQVTINMSDNNRNIYLKLGFAIIESDNYLYRLMRNPLILGNFRAA